MSGEATRTTSLVGGGEPKTHTPQRFRKKPVVVEAIQWTGDNTGAVMEWTGERRNPETGRLELTFVPLAYPAPKLWVEANSAWVKVEPGEWFIRDARGVYPCKPDIFAATYEPEGVPVVARDEADELRAAVLDWWQARTDLDRAYPAWIRDLPEGESYAKYMAAAKEIGAKQQRVWDELREWARRLAGGENEK